MAEIYSTPDSLKLPEIDWSNFNRADHEKLSNLFISDLRNILIKHYGKKKNVGEVVRFPHADGYAQYMVMQMNPLELVHIPLDDAWEFPYIERLTAKDIQDKINQQKNIAKIFGG